MTTRMSGAFAQSAEQLAAEKEMPIERAQLKSESTRAGWVSVLLGVALLLTTVALIGLLARNGGGDVTVVMGGLIAGFGVIGFVLFGLGMNLVSREASPAIDAAGLRLERIIRAIRGKDNGGGQ